jgi:hypothetical protein
MVDMKDYNGSCQKSDDNSISIFFATSKILIGFAIRHSDFRFGNCFCRVSWVDKILLILLLLMKQKKVKGSGLVLIRLSN